MGSVVSGVDFDLGGFEAVNAADPTAAQSLVTKAYGDANYGGGGGPTQFDYVEITSPVTVTATADGNSGGTAVINGNSVTYDGSTRILVEFYAPYLLYNVSGQNILVNLYDGTTDLGRICNLGISAGSFTMSLTGQRFLTPSAAAHTYNIRGWKTSGSGLAQVGAGAGGASAYVPAFMRITSA